MSKKVVLSILATISLISFGAYYARVLYSDDWVIYVANFVFGHMKWFDVNNLRRPMDGALFKLITSIFGVNVDIVYLLNGLILLSAAFLIYLLFIEFFPAEKVLGLGLACLYLVYPADYTRMWLTMTYIHLSWLLALVYAWLLLKYLRNGKILPLLIALICFIIPMFAYEAQLGLGLVWSAFLAVFAFMDKKWKRGVLTLTPVLGGVMFSIWRIIGVRISTIPDPYRQYFQLNPGILYERLIWGVKSLVLGWAVPVSQWAGFKSHATYILLLACLVAACGLILGFIRSRFSSKEQGGIQVLNKKAKAKNYLMLFLAGVVLTIAGYIPMITEFPPSLNLLLSRWNAYAIPGAALMILAAVSLFALFFSRSRAQFSWAVLASIAPLLLVGVAVNVNVQHENKLAWDEQRSLLQEFLSMAPDLKDETTVYFILPGYQSLRPAERTPLTAIWEASGALRVLYGKDTFVGEVAFPDLDPPGSLSFQQNGVVYPMHASPTPYNRTIFMIYDGSPRHLRLVENLQSEFKLNWAVSGYSPNSRIINDQPKTDLRWLITR